VQTNQQSQPRSKSRRPRVIRSKEQWQSLIADYKRSDLPQQKFCEQRGITVSSFSKWRNLLEAEDNTDQSLFVELGAVLQDDDKVTAAASGWQVELELGKGIVLRVRAG